jgi:carbohydrate-selective porin OprB
LDAVVLGATHSSFSPYSRSSSGQRQSYEGMIELGYILQLSKKLALQPGVQVIVNPEGTGDNETLVVPGLQVSFNW